MDARGNELVIRLTRRVPDFTARLTMPFFCAVPPGLPANPEGAREYASAGPYYVAEYLPGRRVTLLQNPYYGGKRPHRVDRFEVSFTSTLTEVIDQIEAGRADWGWIPSPAWAARGREIVRKYGGSRRLQVRPSPTLSFFVLNTRRGIFRNARLRRAVNFAINRAALVREHGYGLGRATDQYLPPGMPGYKDVEIYPSRPNLTMARKWAGGRLRNRRVVLYTINQPVFAAVAQVVKANLVKIGLQVEIHLLSVDLLSKALATPNAPFDMAWYGWAADYPDPYGFLNSLLGDVAYFKSRTYTRRLQQVSRLKGGARNRAYAELDVQLARDAAPLIVYMARNSPTFVSRKVDPRCIVLRPGLDLTAVCLKR